MNLFLQILLFLTFNHGLMWCYQFSRFEMFFRDFFRFMLMYEREAIDVGVIITLDEMAYDRWHGNVKSYRAARASLQRLNDFLTGDYSTIVKVPLYCIGIE